MVGVLEVLEGLPHRSWEHAPQFTALDCYPMYASLAAELRPRTVLEIGAFEGYGLAAFWLGAGPEVQRLDWVDTEAYLAGSNAHCRQNLEAVARMTGWPAPQMDGVRKREWLSWYGSYDLIHVDGDHSYHGALWDMVWSRQQEPRVMLVDDFDFLPDVQRAVKTFSRLSGVGYEHVKSLRGWALFRFR